MVRVRAPRGSKQSAVCSDRSVITHSTEPYADTARGSLSTPQSACVRLLATITNTPYQSLNIIPLTSPSADTSDPDAVFTPRNPQSPQIRCRVYPGSALLNSPPAEQQPSASLTLSPRTLTSSQSPRATSPILSFPINVPSTSYGLPDPPRLPAPPRDADSLALVV